MKKRKDHFYMRLCSILLAVILVLTGSSFPSKAAGWGDNSVDTWSEMLRGSGEEADESNNTEGSNEEESYSVQSLGLLRGVMDTLSARGDNVLSIGSAEDLPSEISEGMVVELTADIVMAEGQTISNIAGVLDGKGHTVTLNGKPLADTVSGTIQNLGVKGDAGSSDSIIGTMSMKLSGTIQMCYSVAKVQGIGYMANVGGLAGDLIDGTIRNSYFAGEAKTEFQGDYGGLAARSQGEQVVLSDALYEESGLCGAVYTRYSSPAIEENILKKNLDELKNSAGALNNNLPDTGYEWKRPTDESNNGLPILVAKQEGGDSGTVDKSDLQTLADRAEQLDSDKYTSESWNALQAALASAKTVLSNEDAVQTDVDAALTALQDALDALQIKNPTEPVAPPADESKIIHITNQDGLEEINSSEGTYYVLDNDITISGWYLAPTGFKGILDGQGHTVTFNNPDISGELLVTLAPGAVIQNVHFTGVQNNAEGGPACRNLQGAIINCYSDISGSQAAGFAKWLDGGVLSNCYSASDGKLGALFKGYNQENPSGTLYHTYWTGNNTIGTLVESGSKTEAEMKTLDFVALLNANRGEYGTAWGQNIDGYPYFGEDKPYDPEKPNLPENRYTVTFKPHNMTEAQVLDTQLLRWSPDDVGQFYLAGNFGLLGVPEGSRIEWSVSQVKPEGGMYIGADAGDFCITGEGSAIVTATEIKEDGSAETAASIQVEASVRKMEALQLLIDGTDVTDQSFTVQGSEAKSIQVRAKYEGEEAYVPVSGARFLFEASDSAFIDNYDGVSSEFRFLKPGTASITVVSRTDSNVKAAVSLTSAYVPVTSITPGISGRREIHGRNANSWGATLPYNPEKLGVIVEPANASFGGEFEVTSSNPEIGEFLVDQYIPNGAGTVTYTASIKDKDPETGEVRTVSGSSEVTYYYLNPLTEVKASQTNLELPNYTELPLDLTWTGERSAEGYTVTEPGLTWTYDKEGIVSITKKTYGYWKKDTEGAEGTPDYALYFPGTDYYVKALKEGTVVATGTQIDGTNDVDPIKLTIHVTAGEAPKVDIDKLVLEGIGTSLSHLNQAYADGYFYDNNDWAVYNLLRAGEQIPEEVLDAYYASVVEEVKTWDSRHKPTDIERVILSLSIMGKDITDVGGVNLAELVYNHPNLAMQGSNGLCWALLAMDAKNTEIPEDAVWTREAIIEMLLTYQNEENGGFGLDKKDSPGIDMTAMILQSLAGYTADERVAAAVEKGLLYLENELGDSYDYSTSESTAQVLLTLTTLGINPVDSEFGQPHENLITSLMDRYYREGKGFSHMSSDKTENTMATVQAMQGLDSYRLYQRADGSYWRLTKESYPDLKPVPNPDPNPGPDPNPNPDPKPDPIPKPPVDTGDDMSVDSLTNTAYGVTLEGEGLTSEMELVITQLKAGNADVERMRKKISSSKALYRVFDVKLLLDGEEIELPGEATLYIPVNEKYNGQTLQVLHCHDSKEVTSLKGKAANGILPVEIDSLSSFGVVVNQKDLPGSSAEEKETTKLTSGVQTGDTAPVGILLLLVLAAGAGIVWVLYKKRKERQ